MANHDTARDHPDHHTGHKNEHPGHWSPLGLELHLTDYSDLAGWKWTARRSAIGVVLGIYCFYIVSFLIEMVNPGASMLGENVTEEERQAISEGIPYGSKMLFMISMGAAGSTLLLLRTFVRTDPKGDLPFAWYLLQPLQGALMALFLYFVFRAGGVVVYQTSNGEEHMNIYVLGSLAIVAGVFSERSFDSLLAASKMILRLPDPGPREDEAPHEDDEEDDEDEADERETDELKPADPQ